MASINLTLEIKMSQTIERVVSETVVGDRTVRFELRKDGEVYRVELRNGRLVRSELLDS